MKASILLLCMLVLSCNSLPVQIAEHSMSKANTCEGAAKMAYNALLALKYNARYCEGIAYPGGRQHAWIEYLEDKQRIILDPARLLGKCRLYRDDWPDCYYRKQIERYQYGKYMVAGQSGRY